MSRKNVYGWLSCTHSLQFPWLRYHSHSYSRLWEILDYIAIPIYSRKVIPIPSHSHSHWNKKSFKNSCSSARIRMIFVRMITQNHSLLQHASQSQYTLMKWKWHARMKANVKWLFFPSSRITEQNLIWYVEKLQWEFIPIPIALFPFPYFYSHSYSHSHDIGLVIVTSIPMGIPWDSNYCSHSFPCTSVIYRQLSEPGVSLRLRRPLLLVVDFA